MQQGKAFNRQRVTDFLLHYAMYIILLAILVTVSIIRPNFLALGNILNILKLACT